MGKTGKGPHNSGTSAGRGGVRGEGAGDPRPDTSRDSGGGSSGGSGRGAADPRHGRGGGGGSSRAGGNESNGGPRHGPSRGGGGSGCGWGASGGNTSSQQHCQEASGTRSGGGKRHCSGDDKPLINAVAPHNWQTLPEEVLQMIFRCLKSNDVLNSSLTCQRWRDYILKEAFKNKLYLTKEESDLKVERFKDSTQRELELRHTQDCLLLDHARNAKTLAFFELEQECLRALLVGAAAWCNPANLESVFFVGDGLSEKERSERASREELVRRGTQETTDTLFMPVLGAFLRRQWMAGETLRHKSSLLKLHKEALLNISNPDETGFAIKHLALINFRLVLLNGDYNFWDFLQKFSSASLKSLDLIYFTSRKYAPRNLLAFQALEQVCISPNHLNASTTRQRDRNSLTTNDETNGPSALQILARLPNLGDLVVYHGCPPESEQQQENLRSAFGSFHQAKPSVRISFFLQNQRNVKMYVPPVIPIHGLELNHLLVNDNADEFEKLKALLPRVSFFSVAHVDQRYAEWEYLLTFLDNLVAQRKTDSAKSKPWRLTRFQYGGKHDADYYLFIAERVGKLDLKEWTISLENVSFPGPHQWIHHSVKRGQHSKRRKAVNCKAPPDAGRSAMCSASAVNGFYRTLKSRLPPSTELNLKTRRTLLGTSSFWKTDPEVLRRLREEPFRSKKKKTLGHWIY